MRQKRKRSSVTCLTSEPLNQGKVVHTEMSRAVFSISVSELFIRTCTCVNIYSVYSIFFGERLCRYLVFTLSKAQL